MQNQLANLTDMMSKFMSSNTASSSGSGTLPAPVQPTVIQSESETLVSEPVVAPVSAPMPNLKSSIPYPSRRDNERRRYQANEQIEKFYEIFKDMSFEISFTDALMLMPKFVSTLKALIGNKEKLSEMARTPMNEHCSAVILNKLPKKLGDPDKFLIPCEFPGMDDCLALADLGASINLMPLFVWKGLLLPELTPTCMTLELADHLISKTIGIAKDVKVKVGVFHFPADFVVVDFEPDPRVSLILERYFLKIGRALIDVHKGELTLQVISFFDVTVSGSPTPSDDPIISTTSPTLTPFEDSDFLLFEEADAFLGLEDDPDSPELDPSYYDLEGDILLLEAILNSDPSPPLPNHEQSVPSFKNELKACEAKTIKSSIDEPPEVELKDLPPHLEYVFLEGNNKLPVIIAKELGDEEKSALIKVLKSHKRAIAWKLSDIQGINPEFYTYKILMEEDYKPAIQHQRRVNPKIHDVIKKRKRLHSHAPTGRSPIVACLSIYAMHRARFKGTKCCKDVKTPNYVLTGRKATLWSKRALSSAEPPEVEFKDLPPHLEYAFLEGDNKLPVIIAKELGEEEKAALIKILIEEDYKPAVQHQRRVNPKIHDVIKKEVEKLLDAGLIYPIFDSPLVSPAHCVPKKGGFTVVKNEENEFIPTRLVTS
nr:reverse transcriptase domain-containing protein [Tanacetum cinerariifolium]